METLDYINEISSLKQIIRKKAESEAIARIFYENGGKDLNSFEVLLQALFKLEFLETEKDRNNFPIYKLTDVEVDGSKMYPESFLREAKEGKYGQAIASCFDSDTLVFDVKETTKTHTLTIKRSEKATYLANDKNRNFAQMLSAGRVRIIDG